MHYVRCCCAKFETISRVCLLVSPSKYVFNILCTPLAVCQLKSLVVQAIFINFHVECLSNLVSHYTITLKSNENTLTYFQSLMWKSSLYLSIRHTNGSFPRNPFARFFFLFQLLFCTCINWLDDRNVFFFWNLFSSKRKNENERTDLVEWNWIESFFTGSSKRLICTKLPHKHETHNFFIQRDRDADMKPVWVPFKPTTIMWLWI